MKLHGFESILFQICGLFFHKTIQADIVLLQNLFNSMFFMGKINFSTVLMKYSGLINLIDFLAQFDTLKNLD